MYYGTEVAVKKEYEYQPRVMMTENLEIPIYVETHPNGMSDAIFIQ